MVSSSIPDPPGFYRLCIVVLLGGCRVGFSPKLVAWWARGSVHAGWAVASNFRPMSTTYEVSGDSYVGR
ncbi:hypothetical protein Hanom_Chr17g01576371 [Helianthus anomalus]